MVRLPGGNLTGERIATIAPFCIDLTEVTVAAYSRCVRSGACKAAATAAFWVGITEAQRAEWSPACNGARKDRQDHPVNCVDWAQSSAYCRVRGERLPTEEEWEWAARGGRQERVYPWGYRAPDSQLCWSGVQKREGTCPVGSFPASDGLGGIHDLAGNVWEFTSSTVAGTDPIVSKGASYNEASPGLFQSSHRDTGEPAFRGPTVGFRCVK
jgi:sulfatase modifying factor 1